jgi:hypothetical protein
MRLIKDIEPLPTVMTDLASFKSLLESHSSDWNLTPESIQKALDLMEADGLTEESLLEDRLLVLFLYAKRVWADEECKELEKLLSPKTTLQRSARARLVTIVMDGERSPTRPLINNKPASFFDEFVRNHSEWSKENGSWVLFRDHPRLKDKEFAHVERFQKDGDLGYMHAPVVMQHYLVAMSVDEFVPMLNMITYLRQRQSPSGLYNHIWRNQGGDSVRFLLKILRDVRRTLEILPDSLSEGESTLREYMDKFGPGLVSRFEVTENFRTSNNWQYTGHFEAPENSMHAMVLIGYRELKGGEYRYLLQNWWKSMPYVEVDLEYLVSSNAVVHFIKERQEKIGPFETNSLNLVECDADSCEQHFPETTC